MRAYVFGGEMWRFDQGPNTSDMAVEGCEMHGGVVRALEPAHGIRTVRQELLDGVLHAALCRNLSRKEMSETLKSRLLKM